MSKQYWAIVNAQDEIVIIAAYGESKEDFLRGWVQDEGERVEQVTVTF